MHPGQHRSHDAPLNPDELGGCALPSAVCGTATPRTKDDAQIPIDARTHSPAETLSPQVCGVYLRALRLLEESDVRYCVGGAYALAHYAGLVRHTKDLDVFIPRDDLEKALALFERAGYRIERTHPHWLAKAFDDAADAFVDLIYGSGNGLCEVDDEWLTHATPGDVLGLRAPLSPAEEIIWSKSFIQERNRFDGADINHILLSRGPKLEWERLLQRFAGHEQVLLGHVMFFQYVFPSERQQVPTRIVDLLMERSRLSPEPHRVCRGTLLSWSQYLVDVEVRGFVDARLQPHGRMTAEQVQRWTAARK